VKFLIDNNLSPLLAESLKAAGHDAVHLRDLGMQAELDPVVLQRAQTDERVLVSADTDFGGLLSRSHATGPSVLLIRRLAGRRAAEQSAIILANLDQIAEDLIAGAVVVIGDDRIRIRQPPNAWLIRMAAQPVAIAEKALEVTVKRGASRRRVRRSPRRALALGGPWVGLGWPRPARPRRPKPRSTGQIVVITGVST
jgi:predicted nuclease of predicted toxin-antitoxin system